MRFVDTERPLDAAVTALEAEHPPAVPGATPEARTLARYRRLLAAHKPAVLVAQLVYVLLFAAYLIYSHTFPMPDVVAVFLLVFAALAMRGLRFLRDWTPFIVLVLGYVGLSGLAPELISAVHIGFPITADRWLFHGTLPTLWLQDRLYEPYHLRWLDYLASFVYSMHFLIPLALAFAFWLWHRGLYWRFVWSYLLLMYAGFATYLLYPMAPPWWASAEGHLPYVWQIMSQPQWGSAVNPVEGLGRYFHVDLVAAMPSMHAGFGLLVFLVLWRVSPRWGWLAVLYPLAMTWAVVYLGEHYVIDCLAGYLYALIAFTLIWGGLRPWRRLLRPLLPRRAQGIDQPATWRRAA